MTILALLPCQDREDGMAHVSQVVVQTGHTCNEGSGHGCCSPFCTCSCCSTARHLASKQVISLVSNTVVRHYPELKTPAVRQQPITIWQPPQLG